MSDYHELKIWPQYFWDVVVGNKKVIENVYADEFPKAMTLAALKAKGVKLNEL